MNLLLAVFWLRLWTLARDRQLAFNRYLAPIDQVGSAVSRFLHPILPGLPVQVTAAFVFAVILVLRGLAVPEHAVWYVTLGVNRVADAGTLGGRIAFSALSFGVFFFKLCAVAVLYTVGRSHVVSDQPATTLAYLSRPISFVPVQWRPLTLFALGILLVGLLGGVFHPLHGTLLPTTPAAVDGHAEAPIVMAMKLALLTLTAWVQVLPLIQSLMFLLIIGSWISLATGGQALAYFCREWITLLLGPLRSYPIRLGMIDLTPIVFAFALGWVHRLLAQVLYNALVNVG